MRIVAHTGPPLHLAEAHALHLLSRMGDVLIPPAVDDEISRHLPDWSDARPSWMSVVALVDAYAQEALAWRQNAGLGIGEAEALALARQAESDWFLTDDTAARLFARALGLEVHGSFGVLLWAAEFGHVDRDEAFAILDSLKGSSLWITERVTTEVEDLLDRFFRKCSEANSIGKMMSDPSAAARTLSLLWTPIVAVTAAHEGVRSGQIAVSVHGASIVPQRPRLTAALWKRNLTHDLVQRSGVCAVHLLRDDQDELVYRLGLHSGRDGDKLAGLPLRDGLNGCPVLLDCLAVYECRVLNAMDGGDMTVFLGEVVAMDGRDGVPLWWRDLRPRMPAEQAAAWDRKIATDIADSLRTMDQL